MARKNKVRLDLEQQLRDKGLYTPAYISLLDDYMFYDAMEKKYQADVEENGSIIQAVSATGKTFDKDNPAAKLAPMYNQRKMDILTKLNLSVDDYRPPCDDGGGLG